MVLLIVGIWWVTLAPATVGGPLSMVLVNGTSMEPTYHTGDLVIGYRQPDPPQEGQVVIFRGPGDAGSPVIHRVREVDGKSLTTRGDNLRNDDPWDTTTDDVLGTARLHLPGVGYQMVRLGQPPILGGLAAVLVVLLLLVYRNEGEEGPAAGSEAGSPTPTDDAAEKDRSGFARRLHDAVYSGYRPNPSRLRRGAPSVTLLLLITVFARTPTTVGLGLVVLIAVLLLDPDGPQFRVGKWERLAADLVRSLSASGLRTTLVVVGIVAVSAGVLLVGRAASLDIGAGDLASYDYTGPFETYKGCAGNSGGNGQGNNCNK